MIDPNVSPAGAAGDGVFTDFAESCALQVRTAQDGGASAVARLTADLVSGWRMTDPRYLECQPDAMYGSYLLYRNENATLSIVLDVFLPGQAAVVHNHLCWCVFTCLEGSERERLYRVPADLSAPPVEIEDRTCPVGQVRSLGSGRNLFHQVECASDRAAVSLHIYGADIGRLERDMWDGDAGVYVPFRSNYSNDVMGLPAYYVP